MKRWIHIFLGLVVLAVFLSGCSPGVSRHGHTRDESPAFTVNQPHDLDYYQMYGP